MGRIVEVQADGPDLDHRPTLPFVPNKMTDGGPVTFDRLGGYLATVYAAL